MDRVVQKGIIFLLGLLGFAFHAAAQTAGVRGTLTGTQLEAPSGSSRTSLSKKARSISSEFNRFSLVMPSFVVHGFTPAADSAVYMPRKMDGAGSAVITPGIGFEYVGSEGGLILGALLKDCYDNFAGTLQLGKVFPVAKESSLALSMGVYVRQSPYACESSTYQVRAANNTLQTKTQTDCYAVDELSQQFAHNIAGQLIDIVPMPFIHFKTALVKTSDFQMDLKVMSNFLLNEVGVAIPF